MHDARRPFWLVLGQSHNPGWHASIGSHDLGAPDLVDGFANGWRIDPGRFGANPTVSVRWEPQRWVWVALGVSLAAALGCVAIVAVPMIRRRRRRGATFEELDDVPRLESPFAAAPAAPWYSVALVSVVAGLLATLVTAWPWGIATGIAMGLSLRSRVARGVVRLLPSIIVVGVGLYVTSGQLRHHYPPNFEWPLFYERARNFTWFAIVLVTTGVAAVWVLGRQRSRRRP